MINQESQGIDYSYTESLSYSSIEHNNSSLNISIPPIPQLDNPDIHYLCPRCHNFPLIEFKADEEYIKYTCNCYKGELIKLDDIFNNEKKYMTILNKKEINSQTIDKVIGFKCISHESLKYNKFKYYCISCNINICKECCQNHLDKSHDVVVFDYQNFEAYEKIKKINEYLNSENIEKNEKIASKDNNIETGSFIMKLNDENKYEKIPEKRIEEIHDYYANLIKIIINDFLSYPNYFHFFNIDNIYRVFVKTIFKKKIEKEKKENDTIRIIFHFNRVNPSIFCDIKERFKEIRWRYFEKMNPDVRNFVLSYKGNVINEELTIEKIIDEIDKERKIMDIYAKEMSKIDNIIIKDVICPVCCDDALIKFDNYKINLSDCKKGHKTTQILFKDFMNTQKLDLSKIICNNCKIVNKFNNSTFFECFTCGQNLCSNCKSNHNNKHDIINYEIKNYICHKHKEKFSLYCEDCKNNICIKCENEHMNHSKLNYNNLTSNLRSAMDDLNSFKRIKDELCYNIETIKKQLDNVVETIEIYYKICYEYIHNNYRSNNINYEKIENINEFIKYNNMLKNEFTNIIKNVDIVDKFDRLMKIKNLMNNNKLNFIKSEILIKDSDVDKDIRIINSYEQIKRELKIEDKNNDDNYENEREIKENCETIINNEKVPFSYYHKFKRSLINKIDYLFLRNMKKINNLFNYCSSLIKIDLSNFNSDSIIDMHKMFSGCESLISINLSDFKAENVIDMSEMFSGCKNLFFVNLSNFNTKKVKDMSRMFSECNSLTFLDVSTFNAENVENLSWMFFGCRSLLSLNLFNFNTQKITNINEMFSGCESLLSLDLSSFNFEQETDIYQILSEILGQIIPECKYLTSIKLSNFNTLDKTQLIKKFSDYDYLKLKDLFSKDGISCLAFNKDFTKVAISKKDNIIYIYEIKDLMKTNSWKLEYKLENHVGYISGLDWNPHTNNILSCSHDKTAFVWEYSNKNWAPEIVVADKIKLGYLCCKWNIRGDKFCAGTSAKNLFIGFYNYDSKWWVVRNIKVHKSSVVCCEIDPTSLFVISGSTDLRVYVSSCYICDIDDKYLTDRTKQFAQKFGSVIYEFRPNCWVNSVAWNKSGIIGYAANQNATIYVINIFDNKTEIIKCKHSPVTLIVPNGENSFFAVCYDRNIFEYEKKEDKWEIKKTITTEEGKKAELNGTKGSFSNELMEFQKNKENLDDTSKKTSHLHQSLISSVNIKGKDMITTDISGFVKYWKL